MGFFDETIPQHLCNDEKAWAIIKDLNFEDVQKIRFAEVYRHYTAEYVDKNTPSVMFLLIVLMSDHTEISADLIKAINKECYPWISEIRFYNPSNCTYVHGDSILTVKRIKQLDGSTRPFVVARPDKPAPAVS